MSEAHVGAEQGTGERQQLIELVTGGKNGFDNARHATGALDILISMARSSARDEKPVTIVHLGYRLLAAAKAAGEVAETLLMRMLTRVARHAREGVEQLELTYLKIDGKPACMLSCCST